MPAGEEADPYRPPRSAPAIEPRGRARIDAAKVALNLGLASVGGFAAFFMLAMWLGDSSEHDDARTFLGFAMLLGLILALVLAIIGTAFGLASLRAAKPRFAVSTIALLLNGAVIGLFIWGVVSARSRS